MNHTTSSVLSSNAEWLLLSELLALALAEFITLLTEIMLDCCHPLPKT